MSDTRKPPPVLNTWHPDPGTKAQTISAPVKPGLVAIMVGALSGKPATTINAPTKPAREFLDAADRDRQHIKDWVRAELALIADGKSEADRIKANP